MNTSLTRRHFLKGTGTAALALGAPAILRGADSPGERVVVGIMGCHGRGMDHIQSCLKQKNTEIAYVCDVDNRAIANGLKSIGSKQKREAKGVSDFRRILDDPDITALTIAAPNHWHAPATILACSAGKHVYVEKPGSHNPHEGELMVRAARENKRVVQMGNQRRTWPWVQEAIQAVHAGEIGKVVFARTWYNNKRPSIGRGQPSPVPEWLDYNLWQGPAPRRPYQDNVVHYNWHWRWHWGNGELGNNGIHALDLARWGLQVDCPVRVSCGGKRYHFDDDQETPDIYLTSYDFGDKGASWESHSCDPHGFENTGFGVIFYGSNGCLILTDKAKILDLNDKLVREIASPRSDADHFANFIDCIRTGKRPSSDIEEGQRSTLLCHLGNIAYRTGHTINLDPTTRRILDDSSASALWRREYEPGWEPKV